MKTFLTLLSLIVLGLCGCVRHTTVAPNSPQPGLDRRDSLSRVTDLDYAESRHVDLWLRHPVFGDPSFDSFKRASGNPIHRGSPPFEWPVNGFFFADPVSGNWYVYVGDYCRGYGACASRCLLHRSTDRGRRWQNLGPVLQGDAKLFDKNGHTPDVSVVFAEGRYHMIYDWGELNFNQEGGLAYAWAEKPEGPFHRATQPITRNTTLTPLLGKYQRTYAATLVRRKADWLIAGMMDSAPNSWVLFTMTSPKPDGPYSERQLVRNVERDEYHPPLMEFFPAFTHDGYLYAPATSVALNRNFNVIFRVPLERATEPDAWEIFRHGSVWHAEDVENEFFGIWGQTFSGWVDASGTFQVMFNSRDAKGLGTVNLARRPWKQPLRKRGFVLTGHEGPSFTCLRREYGDFKLDATMQVRGVARLFWDYRGVLGPNVPQSDATLHPLMRSHYRGVELAPDGWRIVMVNKPGEETTLASGRVTNSSLWNFTLEHRANGDTRLLANDRILWEERNRVLEDEPAPGALGLMVEPHSHLSVEQFRVSGQPTSAKLYYLYTEALLGAGENQANWQERRESAFRHGVGVLSRRENARVKWNVVGRRMALWSPRGPEFGRVEVLVDAHSAGEIDLHAEQPATSQVVWTSATLRDGFHAIVMRAKAGLLPVDCLEVEN
ncbi:MAG: hypothetical protein HY298_03295 [Verrucomicrobia bacterium]|nr:hypothetical protein [Verrucomicrobiota bacterium]